MKRIAYITGLILMLGFSACQDWLDVNNDPSSANNTVPTPDLRLRSIQMQFIDCYESSGTRVSWLTQNITKNYATPGNNNDGIINWDINIGRVVWPYQAWFVYTASNLQPLIDKATAEEAWHYVGAAQLIHAWGFMLMADLYGEMPYTEALGVSSYPKYEDGKAIYYGCMDMLEQAIGNLSKQQPSGATPLANGDIWNGGDSQKWIKLAYGLKARWLNNLSKKADLYDPDAILAALEKAPQFVADNTVMRFIATQQTDRANTVKSLQHTNVGGTAQKMSKWYTDLLTNTFTDGSGVQDPRTTRIIPSAEFNTPTGKEWRLSQGVDLINSDIRSNSGPVEMRIYATIYNPESAHPLKLDKGTTVTQRSNASYSNRWIGQSSTMAARMGDSIYISVYSDALIWILNFTNNLDDRWFAYRFNGVNEDNPNYKDAIDVMSTGSFYVREDGPAHLVCYHEMCFIKAEALMRKGDASGALTAYKAGIRAHMEAMNEKLKDYKQVLGKEMISETEISSFLSSAAVAQTAAELTMAKIMQQKQIAMSFTVQNWTDMRRFNYSNTDSKFGVVYPDFGRPYEADNSTTLECYPGTYPNHVRAWPRRFMQCAHEVNYNIDQLKASNKEATARTILSMPVWWDCATDDEYYSYIR